jgi:drug/metabolite transporter (DMT)-like permease
MSPPHSARPAPWGVPLAFTLLYLCWGTTFLAIRIGVEHFPPGLFGGVRIGLAGLLILAFLGWRGAGLVLSYREYLWAAGIGQLLFVGGNMLITAGEQYVASSAAAVLAATCPLWMALLELLWPWGERLTLRGWVGLIAGFGGVVVMLIPKLGQPGPLFENVGPVLVLASAFCWALGSFMLRRQRGRSHHLTTAAYQMIFGGLGQCVAGLCLGEASVLTADAFVARSIAAFFYLLVFGSLIGFVCYSYLLGHVTVTQAGTYAYVTPVLAILVGGLIGNETITIWIVAGMACILVGVALLRTGGVRGHVILRTEPAAPARATLAGAAGSAVRS